jgi:hypothetical protein
VLLSQVVALHIVLSWFLCDCGPPCPSRAVCHHWLCLFPGLQVQVVVTDAVLVCFFVLVSCLFFTLFSLLWATTAIPRRHCLPVMGICVVAISCVCCCLGTERAHTRGNKLLFRLANESSTRWGPDRQIGRCPFHSQRQSHQFAQNLLEFLHQHNTVASG